MTTNQKSKELKLDSASTTVTENVRILAIGI